MLYSLNEKFMLEIGKIQDPEVFLGIARILKVKLLDDDMNPKDFSDLFEEVMIGFDGAGRKRKKELLKILRAANKEARIENGDSTKDSEENLSN